MDKRQITNYVYQLRELYSPDTVHHRASNQHGYPMLDRLGNHDPFKYLDHHPLEGERQDVELYLCGFPGTRRTLTLRTLIQHL